MATENRTPSGTAAIPKSSRSCKHSFADERRARQEAVRPGRLSVPGSMLALRDQERTRQTRASGPR